MLYKDGIVDTKEIDFLFDVDIYNDDIDIREVAAIQGFYEKHGYIPDNHIVTFLNWLTYSARRNISNDLEDIKNLLLLVNVQWRKVFLISYLINLD